MEPLLQDEHIRALLREADDALRLLERPGDGAPSTEIREALDGIYKDIGRHVHHAWRELVAPRPTAPPEPARPGAQQLIEDEFDFRAHEETTQERTSESLDIDESTDIPEATEFPESSEPAEDLERWYTDEVEIEGSQPLFSPGELEEAAATESVDIGPRGDAAGGLPSLAAPFVAADGSDTVSVHGFTVGSIGGEPWAASLRELIGMIGGPPAEGADLTEEVSRVQWATTQVDHRWAEFPISVQTALLGLLAARARNLQDRLEVDLGPRLALDRLRKHARATGVPSVAGLQADHAPDSASWADDARRWWAALSNGLDGGAPPG